VSCRTPPAFCSTATSPSGSWCRPRPPGTAAGPASLDDDPDPLGTLGPGPTADGEAGTFTAFPWLDAPVRVEPGQAFDLVIGLSARAADVVLDRVFKDQPNDLVVPTAGVFQAGDGFRVVDQRVLRIEPRWGIEHCHYFGHPRTSERLLEWLLAP
jgi:hypothetical protein